MRAPRPDAAKAAETSLLKTVRCAIYTRKSTSAGLDEDFNSLDAQREAGKAYVESQRAKAGGRWRPNTTMAATPAARSTGRRCSGSWPTSALARSRSWSSTRSTA